MSALIGILGALGGTILGFFINDYLQKRRQEREWKRQFNAKMFEQVYKKLYDGVNNVISALESEKRGMSMTTGWEGIQKDTSYVVIDVPFPLFHEPSEGIIGIVRIACLLLPQGVSRSAEARKPAASARLFRRFQNDHVFNAKIPGLHSGYKARAARSDYQQIAGCRFCSHYFLLTKVSISSRNLPG